MSLSSVFVLSFSVCVYCLSNKLLQKKKNKKKKNTMNPVLFIIMTVPVLCNTLWKAKRYYFFSLSSLIDYRYLIYILKSQNIASRIFPSLMQSTNLFIYIIYVFLVLGGENRNKFRLATCVTCHANFNLGFMT